MHEGETITATYGTTTITMQCVRPNAAYVVTTYVGTGPVLLQEQRIEDRCGSYGSEEEARDVARGYALASRAEARRA